MLDITKHSGKSPKVVNSEHQSNSRQAASVNTTHTENYLNKSSRIFLETQKNTSGKNLQGEKKSEKKK